MTDFRVDLKLIKEAAAKYPQPPQGTAEWLRQRLGKVTASRVSDVIAKTKSGPAASRADYMTQLLIERVTDAPGESYVNAAMQWGTDNEPRARAVFEYLEDCHVEEVGFVEHPVIKNAGASPDGLVGSNAILEIKCPNSSTHWRYLKDGKFPVKYMPQVQWQLACTARDFAHFVSFDPRFPDELIYFHQEVKRDQSYIEMLELEVNSFLAELEKEEAVAQKLMDEKRKEKMETVI